MAPEITGRVLESSRWPSPREVGSLLPWSILRSVVIERLGCEAEAGVIGPAESASVRHVRPCSTLTETSPSGSSLTRPAITTLRPVELKQSGSGKDISESPLTS